MKQYLKSFLYSIALILVVLPSLVYAGLYAVVPIANFYVEAYADSYVASNGWETMDEDSTSTHVMLDYPDPFTYLPGTKLGDSTGAIFPDHTSVAHLESEEGSKITGLWLQHVPDFSFGTIYYETGTSFTAYAKYEKLYAPNDQGVKTGVVQAYTLPFAQIIDYMSSDIPYRLTVGTDALGWHNRADDALLDDATLELVNPSAVATSPGSSSEAYSLLNYLTHRVNGSTNALMDLTGASTSEDANEAYKNLFNNANASIVLSATSNDTGVVYQNTTNDGAFDDAGGEQSYKTAQKIVSIPFGQDVVTRGELPSNVQVSLNGAPGEPRYEEWVSNCYPASVAEVPTTSRVKMNVPNPRQGWFEMNLIWTISTAP
ncbi:MAG: WxL domain-containing protein [Lactobacillales bacterium]|jgi:hypothetical protein|nr:WxL domain-containing protein [Lactobacillales bacterium]